jgi:putative nucleotidyltransferase with HDIG domain
MAGTHETLAHDPVLLLRGFASLRRLTGMYPAGHPVITQKLDELHGAVQEQLRAKPDLKIDIIHGDVHLDGVPFRDDGAANEQTVRELTGLGVDSLHISEGVEAEELRIVAQFLWELREPNTEESIEGQLAARGVRHISLGRIVSLDTRWRAQQWPDAPTGKLDPAYAQSLLMTEQAFETVSSGKTLEVVTMRDLVHLLVREVARSNVALAQILALKEYENLTYCHSVNVAILSLLLGRQLGLDEPSAMNLVEAALLHDIGKTKVPLEIVKKPGALDRAERKVIESHTIFGAEILADTPGVHALTPTIALEHHRGVKGDGYPDLGEGVVPHILSQLVSVADVYEALTGARSYQEPRTPEQACLVLARKAGTSLNTALVKAFVAAVSFFPIGSVVRTSHDEIGVVIRTSSSDPLHPVLRLVSEELEDRGEEVDTSMRDGSGAYLRHIAETLPSKARALDLKPFFPSNKA